MRGGKSVWTIVALLGWLLLIGGVLYWLRSNQERWVTGWSNAETLKSWDEFRDFAQSTAKLPDGTSRPVTVERKVPRSSEPPVLILLREHFTMVQCGAVLFSSVLYLFAVVVVRGLVLAAPKYQQPPAEKT